jgi:hypothetical protein
MVSDEFDVTKEPKKRSVQAKKGRHRYNLDLLKQIEKRIDSVEQMQRTIVKGLEGMFHFEKVFVEKVACVDEVDAEILQLLYQSQPTGLFPKDIARRLPQYRLNRYNVLRRIKTMNRKVEKEIGQHVAEKRGHHWALTSFAVEVWGEDVGDVEEKERLHEEP